MDDSLAHMEHEELERIVRSKYNKRFNCHESSAVPARYTKRVKFWESDNEEVSEWDDDDDSIPGNDEIEADSCDNSDVGSSSGSATLLDGSVDSTRSPPSSIDQYISDDETVGIDDEKNGSASPSSSGQGYDELDESAYLWLLMTLDNNDSDAAIQRQGALAAALSPNNCTRVSADDVLKLRANLSAKYCIEMGFICPVAGHRTMLKDENEECFDCAQDSSCMIPKRGTIGERMRLVQCDIRTQLEHILVQTISTIRSHHESVHHGANYVDGSDFSDRNGSAFLAGLETPDEFLLGHLRIQLFVNCDGFQLKQNTRGGCWCLYASLWDLPSRVRNNPQNALFIGIIGYGLANKIDEDIVDELVTRILPQLHKLSVTPIEVSDENGAKWKCTIHVTAQCNDAEAQSKLNGAPAWQRLQKGCLWCYIDGESVQRKSGKAVGYEGVPSNLRTVNSARRDAEAECNGFSRLSAMHRLVSPVCSIVDILHCLDLGVIKDIEMSMRGESSAQYLELRLPRGIRMELSTWSCLVELPTNYPKNLLPFTAASKSARETRLSVLVHCAVALASFPLIRWGNISSEVFETKMAHAAYMSLLIFNVRRLFDRVVDRDTLQQVASCQRQIGELQKDTIGLRTFKMHVLNAHLPFQLDIVGNVADCDCGPFEHLHQFLKRELTDYNRSTFEVASLKRTLLRREVASRCEEIAPHTTCEQLASYVSTRNPRRCQENYVRVGEVEIPPRSQIQGRFALFDALSHCDSFYRTIRLHRMTISTHEPEFGKRRPLKSRQDIITVRVNGEHRFGKVRLIGRSSRFPDEMHVLLQCFETTCAFETLVTSIRAGTELEALFRDNVPHFSKYMAKIAPGFYDLCVSVSCIVAQAVVTRLGDTEFLIALPARIY